MNLTHRQKVHGQVDALEVDEVGILNGRRYRVRVVVEQSAECDENTKTSGEYVHFTFSFSVPFEKCYLLFIWYIVVIRII